MRSITALLLVSLGVCPVFAMSPATGTLLVATEELRDPRFSETVILLLHYGPDGAVGVAINRPTWVDAAESFPGIPIPDGYTGHIYFGGPVAPANIVTLVRLPDSGELDLDPIVDDVYVGTSREFLRQTVIAADTEQALRLYAGYASWDGGQLDREIAAGSWRVVPASAEFIFAAEPLELWLELHAPVSELRVSWLDDRPTLALR